MKRPRLLVAAGLVLAAVSGVAPAAEPPPGAANFRPPGYVPDYFSNESGPIRGGPGAPVTAPMAAPVAAPAAAPVAATPAASAPARVRAEHDRRRGHRMRSARARGHHWATRTKAAAAHRRAMHRPQASRHRAAHLLAAREPARAHAKAAAAKRHAGAAAKARRVARAGS